MTTVYAILGAILLLIGDFYAGYHFGGQSQVVKTDTQEIKTAAADSAQVHTQEVTVNQAEAVHDQEIEHPPTLVIKQPVWLREPAAVCSVQVPTQTAPVSAPSGTTDPGPTVDLRPQLAAFAQRYEQALSDCRRMSADWPQ